MRMRPSRSESAIKSVSWALTRAFAPLAREVLEELLLALLDPFNTTKPFQVGQAHVGDHAACRLGDITEVSDLSLVVGAHFHKGKPGVARHREQGERHPDVVVEVALGGVHLQVASDQRFDELFGGGFSVASGEPEYRRPETVAVSACRILQCGQAIRHVHQSFSGELWVVHHSGNAPFLHGLQRVWVAVEPRAFEGKIKAARTALARVRCHTG